MWTLDSHLALRYLQLENGRCQYLEARSSDIRDSGRTVGLGTHLGTRGSKRGLGGPGEILQTWDYLGRFGLEVGW